MIPYIILGFITGAFGAALFIVDMVKQKLKTGSVRMGKRVYCVVQVEELKSIE